MSLNQKKRITTLMGAAGILIAVIGSSLSAVWALRSFSSVPFWIPAGDAVPTAGRS